MNLNQLKYFVATADTGSMNRAAAEVFISRQSLSTSIQSLEQEFGAKLLYRTGSGVELTDNGRIVYELARNILTEISVAKSRISGESDKAAQVSLHVYAAAGFAASSMYRVIERFKEALPDIVLVVQGGNPMECLERLSLGEADMAFIGFMKSNTVQFPDAVRVLRQYDEKQCFLLPQSHPFASRKSLSIGELEDYPFILFERSHGHKATSAFREELCKAVPDIRFSLITDNIMTSVEAVANGAGVGIVPETAAKTSLKEHLDKLHVTTVQILPGFDTRIYCCANAESYETKKQAIDEFQKAFESMNDF